MKMIGTFLVMMVFTDYLYAQALTSPFTELVRAPAAPLPDIYANEFHTASPMYSTSTLSSSLLLSETESKGVDVESYSRQEYTDMSPIMKSGVEWLFVAYVVFSLLAGVKEFTKRYSDWKESK